MKLILSLLLCTSFLVADFIRSDNGVVFDTKTGLSWQDENQTITQTYQWNGAVTYCNNLNYGGFSDWRVPDINELLSIGDTTKTNPAMDSTFQHRSSEYYWSSTTYTAHHGHAWAVDMSHGYYSNEYSKNHSFYVRCVRGGQ